MTIRTITYSENGRYVTVEAQRVGDKWKPISNRNLSNRPPMIWGDGTYTRVRWSWKRMLVAVVVIAWSIHHWVSNPGDGMRQHSPAQHGQVVAGDYKG